MGYKLKKWGVTYRSVQSQLDLLGVDRMLQTEPFKRPAGHS